MRTSKDGIMSRTPLVLIPGLTCTRALWERQIAALSDIADITIADHTKDDTMAAIARRILAAAPPRFALAGLSMGGYISFEIMRQAPERVTKLALLDTRVSIDPADRNKDRLATVEQARREGMAPVMKGFLPKFVLPSRVNEEPLASTVIKMGVDTGAEAFARQQAAIMARPSSEATLDAIKCPTLVLCGRSDVLTTLADHEHMHARLPGSTLVVIENCGHLTTLERPDEVNAAMRSWLEA